MAESLNELWGNLMFINLGNNYTLRLRDIISIMDYGVVSSSSMMEKMIRLKESEEKVVGSKEVAKSIIFTKEFVYYSKLSVPTLKKRSSITGMVNKFEKYP